jgi:hypothetical protein
MTTARCWNAIRDAWAGHEALGRVFWVYGVLASATLAAVFLLTLAGDGAPRDGAATRQLLLAAFVPYTVWVLGSIWRCAGNARSAFLGLLARAMTIAWALNAALLVLFAELDLIVASAL